MPIQKHLSWSAEGTFFHVKWAGCNESLHPPVSPIDIETALAVGLAPRPELADIVGMFMVAEGIDLVDIATSILPVL